MDIDFIKTKIFKLEESKKIQPGEYISVDLIKLLKQGTIPDRTACFAPSLEMKKYETEIVCVDCGKTLNMFLSKTKLLDYLRGAWEYHCDECLYKIEKAKEQERERIATELKKSQEEQDRIIEKNTENYIKIYLDPDSTWTNGTAAKYKTNAIIYKNYLIDNDVVAEYIQNMGYEDFLNTPYWVAISLYTKYLHSFKCALCSNKGELRTHHKTYQRHGYEHIPEVIREDLIVLCNDCHEKFHDIF